MGYYSSILIQALLIPLVLQIQTVNGAVIPPKADSLFGPDGSKLLPQTFTEIQLDNGLTAKMFDPPAPQSASPGDQVKRVLNKRIGHCGGSSFINKTSLASPNRLDCHALRGFMRDTSKSHRVAQSNGWIVLAAVGTCTFGAKTDHYPFVLVGNDDIADLVRDTVTMFSWNNRCAAEGAMSCPNFEDVSKQSRVEWAVWHT